LHLRFSCHKFNTFLKIHAQGFRLEPKVLDLLDYSDENDIIDYNGDVNAQLYKLFGIDDRNQQHIQDVLGSKE